MLFIANRTSLNMTMTNMEKAKTKKISPEEKRYQSVCKLVGVWSLTELRFVTKRSVLSHRGVGPKTLEYISGWLDARGFSFGRHKLKEYLEKRAQVWAEETCPIVFKYKIRPVVAALGVSTEWAVGEFWPEKSNFGPSGKPKIVFRGVTSGEAQDLIDEFGLVLAEKNRDGEIYDSPDGRFLKHFGHGSADLSRAHNIGIAEGEAYDE